MSVLKMFFEYKTQWLCIFVLILNVLCLNKNAWQNECVYLCVRVRWGRLGYLVFFWNLSVFHLRMAKRSKLTSANHLTISALKPMRWHFCNVCGVFVCPRTRTWVCSIQARCWRRATTSCSSGWLVWSWWGSNSQANFLLKRCVCVFSQATNVWYQNAVIQF